MEKEYFFKDVTLLITHYNRSSSLNHLLSVFREQRIRFGDIVVSDDGSKPEHLSYLEELRNDFAFRLILTPKNKGLGNNINKGQDAVKTPYTLYVQEDFEPARSFAGHFTDALELMNKNPRFDIARFYAYIPFPYLEPFGYGFSEMSNSKWAPNYLKIYMYSDHPHLRRSSFFEKFGRYKEGIKGDKTEYRMCISFLKNKGQGIFYEDFQALFIQKNTEEEPSTMTGTRTKWKASSNPLIAGVRYVYRQLKYNYDILFMDV
ncbi:glycosyltransferase [Hufsiella ginkgonis]|uniref:Glycosyltransferase n=1 Tax=Hufsiella ginkgonis TaxID=2695274 RepID=A0A7K1Y0D4_9SPHI|nr:glycosyltransferase [Hufsiella ginkgonis]MXV16176.1 glycosyltransferase [Hufsiella ginkgonis]